LLDRENEAFRWGEFVVLLEGTGQLLVSQQPITITTVPPYLPLAILSTSLSLSSSLLPSPSLSPSSSSSSSSYPRPLGAGIGGCGGARFQRQIHPEVVHLPRRVGAFLGDGVDPRVHARLGQILHKVGKGNAPRVVARPRLLHHDMDVVGVEPVGVEPQRR
jgi:hypothetical protein